MKLKHFTLFALVAAVSGCHHRPAFKSLAAECADRADVHGAKVKKAIGRKDVRVMWNNHYNRAEGRCYMSITFIDDRPGGQPQRPRSFVQLHDPIEGRMVAGYTTAPIGGGGHGVYCFIMGKDLSTAASPCADAQALVTDRMMK